MSGVGGEDDEEYEIVRAGAPMARLTCPAHNDCDERPDVWVGKPRVPGASVRFWLVCPVHKDGWMLMTNHIRTVCQFADRDAK